MKRVIETICQSCGMPLNDPHYLGTESDGSPSEEYCQYCYKDGIFTDHGISVDEKIQKNINLAVKYGTPKDQAIDKANRIIPYLKRWR